MSLRRGLRFDERAQSPQVFEPRLNGHADGSELFADSRPGFAGNPKARQLGLRNGLRLKMGDHPYGGFALQHGHAQSAEIERGTVEHRGIG